MSFLFQALLAIAFIGWMFPVMQFIYHLQKAIHVSGSLKEVMTETHNIPNDVIKSVIPSLIFMCVTLFFICLNHLFGSHIVKLVREQILFEFEMAVAVFGWLRIIYNVVLACQKRPKFLDKHR